MTKQELMKARIGVLGGGERSANISTMRSHFEYYASSSPGYKEFLIDDSGVFIQGIAATQYPFEAEFSQERKVGVLFESSNSSTEFDFQTTQDLNIGTMMWFNNSFWIVKEKDRANDALTTGKIELCNKKLNFEDCGNYYTVPYYIQKNTVSLDNGKYFVSDGSQKTFITAATPITVKLKVNKRLMGETFGDNIPQCWSIVSLNTDEDLLAVVVKSSPFNEFTDNIPLRICDWNNNGEIEDGITSDFTETLDYSDEILMVKNTDAAIDPTLIDGSGTVKRGSTETYTAPRKVTWNVEFVGGEGVAEIVDKTDTTVSIKGLVAGKFVIITANDGSNEYKKQILIKNL